MVKESVLNGYQLVKLDGEGPKYLTTQKDKQVTVSTLLLNNRAQRASSIIFGCIVEDLASGIALSEAFRTHNYDAIVTVNYGTRVSPEVLYLNKTFNFGVVWLDNDGEHIIRQAEKIAKVWGMLSGKPIEIERTLGDPKNISITQMRTTIESHSIEAKLSTT